jgi:hypothetical protein
MKDCGKKLKKKVGAKQEGNLKLEDLANAITDCEMELKESSCYS